MRDFLLRRASSRDNRTLMIGVPLFVILTDQISKLLILQRFQRGEILPVVPGFFNLTLTFNEGAAFGLWSQLPSGWRECALGLSIAVAIGVIITFLKSSAYQSIIAKISLYSILGGALGNVIDRLRLGAVVDFLDVYLDRNYVGSSIVNFVERLMGNAHWPAFNIADTAISLGVLALVFLPPLPETKESPEASS